MKGLKTLKIGRDTFKGDDKKKSVLVMKNLNELSTLDAGMNAMRNASDVTLNTIPKLSDLSLRFAFVNVSELKMENASMLENNGELMRIKEELRERRENGIVLNADDLENLPAHVKAITVNACEDYQNEVLDLSRFTELEALTIGDGCFNKASKVSVVGLAKLKSMTVGAKSFQNESNDSELVVSDCPELISLSVGNESFKGFKEMKLSEVKALKTITIGDECFKDCDLVLRDLKSVESVVIGVNSFEKSRHSVVESGCVSMG